MTANLELYRALGFPLVEERHEDGPLHYAAEIDGVHFAIYPADGNGRAPGHRDGGATLVGFVVDDVEAAAKAARTAGADVIRGPEDAPWGRRLVLRDFDGRAIELTQSRA